MSFRKNVFKMFEDDRKHAKVWKEVNLPLGLKDALSGLTKDELDGIRSSLNIMGVSNLKKEELVNALTEKIPSHITNNIEVLDQERYQLLNKAVKDSGGAVRVEDDFPMVQAKTLRGDGLLFPCKHEGQMKLAMPKEIQEIFNGINDLELQAKIRRNTEWVKLTHGMLHFYGLMSMSVLHEKLEQYTKQEIDYIDLLMVLNSAMGYYKQVFPSSAGRDRDMVESIEVPDAKVLLHEQESRPTIDYYPFSKQQLLEASNPNYIERTTDVRDLSRFLISNYNINKGEIDEILLELFLLINTEESPTEMLDFFQEMFEIQSFEEIQELMDIVMKLHNNTRLWMLKGHTPYEIKEDREHLMPLPTEPFSVINSQKSESNVIDFATGKKVGRNEPCPCGSGKKFKKCCGR